MKILPCLVLLVCCVYAADKTPLILTDVSPIENEVAFNETLLEVAEPPSSFQNTFELPAPHFEPRAQKRPWIAIGLSSLFPGLGHVYLGDMKTAGSLMGSAGVGIAAIPFTAKSPESMLGVLTSFQAVSSYSMYAAYRDVRTFNGISNYHYQMPQDTFSELSLAPFSWSIMKKPEVWGGLLGSMAVAAGVGYLITNEWHIPTFSKAVSTVPLIALPVAISEECLFRGLLQSQISESLNPTTGIVLSSLLFGAAHIPNAFLLPGEYRSRYFSFSLPMITLGGAYMGWLTHKNHSLKESVAMHMWYDFIIFSAGALAAKAAIGSGQFSCQFSF